jgi:hypothetical protein
MTTSYNLIKNRNYGHDDIILKSTGLADDYLFLAELLDGLEIALTQELDEDGEFEHGEYSRTEIIAAEASVRVEYKLIIDAQRAIEKILDAKKEEGADAYLWLHTSGDCILWPSEEKSDNDDGAKAIGRWQLSELEMTALVISGSVDEIA